MAYVSDVNNALVAAIAAVLYPSGTGNPLSPITGTICKIFPGWPSSAQLDADLKVGTLSVSVFSDGSGEQNTTRYMRKWATRDLQAVTFAAAIDASGTIVTFSGAQPAPFYLHNVGVLVNGLAFVYQTQAGDSPATIAAGLAALINPVVPASANGAVLTLPSARGLVVRFGTTGTSIQETRRQNRPFMITVWAPTPALRDLAAAPIDAILADTAFLALADGSSGRLIYQRSRVDDAAQKENLYRVDLTYLVEYATTKTETDTQVVVTTMNVLGGLSPTGTVQATPPVLGTFNQ